MERGCGVLLPISSIPNKFGFGCFSEEAFQFVDYLCDLGVKYWQILPLGIVDSVASPYSSVSSYAGEPLYINLREYLTDDEIKSFGLNDELSFDDYRERKHQALKLVYEKFGASLDDKQFISENKNWVYDYALYMTMSVEFKTGFSNFSDEYKDINSEAVKKFKQSHKKEIEYQIFLQFLFFSQWFKLKSYANKNGVKIIGDIPIYCALDSSDVFAGRENFLLNKKGLPTYISGVPGDYFNPDGQIWNNPLYNYKFMKQNSFKWWVARLKHLSKLYDLVRIDHFRGFATYFAIPYGDTNTKRGIWMKGPGMSIFEAFYANGIKNLILEDLGVYSNSTRVLRKKTGLAGMKVMQFAFDGNPDNVHLPQNCEKNSVAYLGTHDNDTFVGFLSDLDQKALVCEYFNIPKNTSDETVTKIAIEELLSTASDIVVLTMQDILFEGREFRINTPGTSNGNWLYKLDPDYRENEFNKYLKELIKIKNR